MFSRSAPALQQSLQVEELHIAVTRKSMKTIRLRICAPDASVRVSAPRRASDALLRDFVQARLPWIRKHRQKMLSRPPVPVWQSLDAATKKQFHAKLQEQLPPLIARYEQALGVRVSSVTLRHMKTRWGTCNTRSHRITLNLELARHSPEALEYVVAHELAHLRVPGHGPRFYALLDEVMPDWKERRKGLCRTPPSSLRLRSGNDAGAG